MSSENSRRPDVFMIRGRGLVVQARSDFKVGDRVALVAEVTHVECVTGLADKGFLLRPEAFEASGMILTPKQAALYDACVEALGAHNEHIDHPKAMHPSKDVHRAWLAIVGRPEESR